MTNSTLTTQARWENAITEAEANGVVITENLVPDYDCQCCITSDEYGIENGDESTPFAYSMGSKEGLEFGYYWSDYGYLIAYEDSEHTVSYGDYSDDEDENTYYEEQEVSRESWKATSYAVDFKHGNGAGEILAAAFKNHGFPVDWDGTESTVITVTI